MIRKKIKKTRSTLFENPNEIYIPLSRNDYMNEGREQKYTVLRIQGNVTQIIELSNIKKMLGLEAQICNPRYSGGFDNRTEIPGQPRQKVHEILSQKPTGHGGACL
jgi:hypothetical protein